jgi:Siphovirus Gp157
MNIVDAINNLYSMLESNEVDNETFANTIESLQIEIVDEIDSVSSEIIKNESMIKSIDDEICRLKKRKNVIMNFLTKTNQKKIKTAFFDVTKRKNPHSLKITGHIPDQFIDKEIVYKTRYSEIKDILKSGEKLEFAYLEQSESLQIK